MTASGDPGCPRCGGTGFDVALDDLCGCVMHRYQDCGVVDKSAPAPAAPADPHGFVLDVGKHAGDLITRVPIGYLRWMVNISHQYSDIAEAEIKRRGTELPDIEVSAHAVDRASLRLLNAWRGTRYKKEGIHSWLARMADRSLDNAPFRANCHQHMGIVFVFAYSGKWPVLKSVWPAQQNSREEDDEEDCA